MRGAKVHAAASSVSLSSRVRYFSVARTKLRGRDPEEPAIALDAAEMRGANVHSARSASRSAARFAASAASARAFLRAKRSATDSSFATEV